MSIHEVSPSTLSFEERINSAWTFEELVEIAIDQISQMPQPVGIVCGPITSGGLGSMDANIAEFDRQIKRLQDEGKNIFSQVPFEPQMQEIKKTPYYDPTRDHLMEAFYGTLLASGVISELYFIPGWESSYGSRWEHERAKTHNIKVTYLTGNPPQN